MRIPTLGAVAGLFLGLAILGLLGGLALFKNSPGGLAENQMWFGLFATIWGMPLSIVTDTLVPGGGRSLSVVAITLPLNWSLLGLVAGTVLEFLRRKRESLR